jgi:hypothetical protein
MIETTGKQQRHGQNGQLVLKWGIPTKVVHDEAWPGESLCFLNREKHFPTLRTQDAAKVSVGQYGGSIHAGGTRDRFDDGLGRNCEEPFERELIR